MTKMLARQGYSSTRKMAVMMLMGIILLCCLGSSLSKKESVIDKEVIIDGDTDVEDSMKGMKKNIGDLSSWVERNPEFESDSEDEAG
mmetsp:Transcript_20258/g.28496  ORF Transcript_20258/g.28496 Transcript_20258/m.28496 type:complete len:87 (+) Transcript_20258:22-282(+)